MIASINLKNRLAVLQDDQCIEITTLLDSEGEETSDISECVSFVCGPDHNGKWHTGLRRDYRWQGNV